MPVPSPVPYKRMRLHTWERKFKPQRNPRRETTDRYDGAYYETYGQDLADVLAVANTDPGRVWTEVIGDRGGLIIIEGYHLVNRNSYFITEVPADPNVQYEVR